MWTRCLSSQVLMNFCAFSMTLCLLHHSPKQPANLLERSQGRFYLISWYALSFTELGIWLSSKEDQNTFCCCCLFVFTETKCYCIRFNIKRILREVFTTSQEQFFFTHNGWTVVLRYSLRVVRRRKSKLKPFVADVFLQQISFSPLPYLQLFPCYIYCLLLNDYAVYNYQRV